MKNIISSLLRRAALIVGATFIVHLFIVPAMAQRVELPITRTLFGGADLRFSIPLSIGGQAPIQVMLDTGSVGLRVLEPALSPGAEVTLTNTPNRYGYGSGVQISGVVGTAQLGFGSLATASPVNIQVVTRIGCNNARPRCAGGHLTLQNYGFGGGGRPHAGFPAILGVSLAGQGEAPGGIANPLLSVGSGRWIVEIPRPGDNEPGRLILNPTSSDLAGFEMYPLAGANGAEIDGCLENEKTGRSFCGPALLDTGAVGARAFTPHVTRTKHWPQGTPGTLRFTANGLKQEAMRFRSGRHGPASSVVLEHPPRGQPPHLRPGVLPFYGFSVLFDTSRGAIGLKARTGH